MENVGNTDLCGCSAVTDYYSVIFISFVNTGLAISLDHLKKDGVFKCFPDPKWICREERSFGYFVNSRACFTSPLYLSFQNTFWQIRGHMALRIKSFMPR